MVSTRDLVEAESWERRRRVRAFVTGDASPDASDMPARARPLVLGAIAAALVCLVVAAMQFV